jgi:hypothetical protein
LFSYADTLFPAVCSASTANNVGYAVGGGLEYAFTPNVSVKGEFLYSQFGNSTSGLIINQFNPNFTNSFATSARVQEEMRYLWHVPMRLDNSKLLSILGDEPHTPIEEAVRASLTGLGCLPAE